MWPFFVFLERKQMNCLSSNQKLVTPPYLIHREHPLCWWRKAWIEDAISPQPPKQNIVAETNAEMTILFYSASFIILFYSVLFYSILFCPVLSCPVPSRPVPPHPVPFRSVLFCSQILLLFFLFRSVHFNLFFFFCFFFFVVVVLFVLFFLRGVKVCFFFVFFFSFCFLSCSSFCFLSCSFLTVLIRCATRLFGTTSC